MLETVLTYTPFLFVGCYILAFYLGSSRSEMDSPRSTFWVATIATFVIGKVIESVFQQFYAKQDTEMGFYLGMAFHLIAISVIVYFWAQVCAGRAVNSGRSRKWAWIVMVPVAGILWLGLIQSPQKQ